MSEEAPQIVLRNDWLKTMFKGGIGLLHIPCPVTND